MRLRDYLFDVAPKIVSYERARKGGKRTSNPLTITFSVTGACRSLCKTCNIGRVYMENPDIAKKDLSLNEIESVFKSLGHIYFFNVSGGEPFMRMDLPEILKLAFIHLKPKLISIPTNSLAPKSIEKATLKILAYMDEYLPPHVPLSIKPSIDGVGEMHDYVRGIKGNFVKLEETIDRLLAIREKNPRLHVDLGTVISNYNLNHLDDLEAWVHKRGIESYRHEIAEQRVEFHNVGDPITPSPRAYKQLTRDFSNKIIENIKGKALHTKVTESVRLAYYDVANNILKQKQQVTPCYGGLSNIHMDYNGEIWPCCILGGEQSMGNVRDWDYNIQALMDSPRAKTVIEYISNGNCACPLASQWLNNVLLTPKHMLNVLYILLVKFPFRLLSPSLGKPKVDKEEAIILKKAGTIPTPSCFNQDELEKNDKEFTEVKPITNVKTFRVKEINNLSNKNYILTIDRHGIDFIPGQFFILGPANEKIGREYTIYSSRYNSNLKFMISEIENGQVSGALRKLEPGDEVRIEGPLGYFHVETDPTFKGKHIFIATGAGIAPFHSFITSNPDLNYQVIHGVRKLEESFDTSDYEREKMIICTSREDTGDYHGRVTDYLRDNPVNAEDIFYICGNTDMLYETYDILISQGVTRKSIKVEVFY